MQVVDLSISSDITNVIPGKMHWAVKKHSYDKIYAEVNKFSDRLAVTINLMYYNILVRRR